MGCGYIDLVGGSLEVVEIGSVVLCAMALSGNELCKLSGE